MQTEADLLDYQDRLHCGVAHFAPHYVVPVQGQLNARTLLTVVPAVVQAT